MELKMQMPKYRIVEQKLELDIHEGRYESRLPGERVLAKTHQVSYMTMRKAIENLVDRGLLYKVPTQGVYVRTPGIAASVEPSKKQAVVNFRSKGSGSDKYLPGYGLEANTRGDDSLTMEASVSEMQREILELKKANSILRNVASYYASLQYDKAANR